MKGVFNGQFNGLRVEDDKKKKRRPVRKSKIISPLADPSELASNGCTLSKPQFPRASDISFNSLPALNINDGAVPVDGVTQNQHLFSSDSNGKVVSNLRPKMITREDAAGSYPTNGVVMQQNSHQKKPYARHWPIEVVNEALQKGQVFKAKFRVNAHNRIEAYCKIDGMLTDVLIPGIAYQNRAVEGDTVAIKIDPVSLWTRMKGPLGASNNPASLNDSNSSIDNPRLVNNSCKGKDKVEIASDSVIDDKNYSGFSVRGINEARTSMGSVHQSGHYTPLSECSYNRVINRDCPIVLDPSKVACDSNDVGGSLEEVCAIVNSFPSKRPTGRVVSIIERSPRRDAVVGFLNAKQFLSREAFRKEKKKNLLFHNGDYIMFIPNDPKFTKMMVFISDLPSSVVKRLEKGDATIEKDLVGAWICGWGEGNFIPHARVEHIFGRGGEIEPHITASLFENNINISDFSPELLTGLPPLSWKIPSGELQKRRDLRNFCTLTIDPSTATDLDDALSVERLSNGNFRVGVHIADVSYFVLPDTSLDIEAQVRATSVYLSQGKLPMLPPCLSENVGSLNPGGDKLAFSIIWDISLGGEILDQWVGRSIIRSCCKLSYRNAQDIIDGLVSESGCPQVYDNFEWSDVCKSVQNLFEISKILKENRYSSGALRLNNSRLSFLLDDDGVPYESMVSETLDSNFLIEEFMLLANTTAAEVIYKAYPGRALLRKHPEPNLRKIKEFEAFCLRHGLELDTSSSAQFHNSMEKFREKLESDPVLFNILVNYATKSMQLASYFSSGELKDGVEDGGHYALGVPLYTHFTSPLRRYADIVVHRTLAAALEAEEMYSKLKRASQKAKIEGDLKRNCFTRVIFDKDAAESAEGKAALSAAASKHGVPSNEILTDIAAHCNERKMACRNVKDASDKLYLWFILKKEKILLTEARVLALGPRFMSVYVPRLAIERRLYYDEVEDLVVEWLETTSKLILSLSTAQKSFQRRGSPGNRRTLEEVALVTCPTNLDIDLNEDCGDNDFEIKNSRLGNKSQINEVVVPAVFPLTVSLLSTIPVALHAMGGEDGPLDIGARLYMSTYLR